MWRVCTNNNKLILTESKSLLQNTTGSQNDIEKLNDDFDKRALVYKVGLASSILTDSQKYWILLQIIKLL